MAYGAVSLAIGLVVSTFGTAYLVIYFSLGTWPPPVMWGIVVLGVCMVAGGIYTCVIGAQEPGARIG